MRQLPLFLTILILMSSGNTKAQDEAVNIHVDTLSPAVFMLTGEGGNIGLYIGEEYAFMVDDQFERLSDRIKATIAGMTAKPLAFLFNTHMHGDHTGGNANFNSGQTTIVAHDNVRERVKENQQKALDENKITPEYLSRMLPEVTFSKDITFYDGTETIMAFHVHNAHTDGDAMVYFVSSNVLHMGDTYFAGRYPYIDLNSGGSVEGYINAQKKALLVINEDTRIIPGHGRPSDKQELETYVAMLEDIRNNVLKAIAAGKSLEEIKADPSISGEYDEAHGSGFISPDRLRETFFNGLQKK